MITNWIQIPNLMNIKHQNNMLKIHLFTNGVDLFIFYPNDQCNQMPECIYSVVLDFFK